MTSNGEWLPAFCRLVANDGLCEASILQTQLRHARNLASYIAARATPATRRLDDHDVVLGVLEAQIEHGLKPRLNDAMDVVDSTWKEDPVTAFARFIELRANAETIEQQVLENVRRVMRSIRQTAYVHPTEFPPLSLFFGLEQAKIAERVDGMARDYHAELRRTLERSSASSRFGHGALALSYEYIGASNHSHTEKLIDGVLELSTQVSVPIWLLYTPRYLPTICHELAHPLAAELLGPGSVLEPALRAFRPKADRVIEHHLGRAALGSIPNISAAIARELLTDVLSLRAAGPGYAIAWHASTLGRGHIEPQQRLSLPTCVRLRLLAEVARGTLAAPLAEVLDQDTALYRAILERRGYVEKARFQEALHDACGELVSEFVRALPTPSRSEPAWGAAAAAISEAFDRAVPADEGSRFIDEIDLGSAWTGEDRRSVPGLLWQVHVRAAHDRISSIPEGRIFHMLHAPRWADWRETEYSEWLWLKRIMRSTRDTFRRWWLRETGSRSPLIGDVIGAYNFVSIREPFRARHFDEYPPMATDQPFHATRQILVGLERKGVAPTPSLREGFAQPHPLLIIELHLPSGSDPPPELLELAMLERTGLRPLAVFKTLGTGDVVVAAQLERIEAAPTLLDALRKLAPRARTLTSIVLPEAFAAAEDGDRPSRGKANVRAFLRFHTEPAKSWLSEAGIEPASVERVLGADDAELVFAIPDTRDLEKVLTIADKLALSGALATFDARVGFASWP